MSSNWFACLCTKCQLPERGTASLSFASSHAQSMSTASTCPSAPIQEHPPGGGVCRAQPACWCVWPCVPTVDGQQTGVAVDHNRADVLLSPPLHTRTHMHLTCLCFLTDEKEESILGSIPLLSFRVAAVQPSDNISRKHTFKVSWPSSPRSDGGWGTVLLEHGSGGKRGEGWRRVKSHFPRRWSCSRGSKWAVPWTLCGLS